MCSSGGIRFNRNPSERADGSTTTWCSASNFCSNVGQGGTLDFNLASLTGSALTGSISGTTLTVGTITSGALQPGAALSGAGITGSPTLVACTSNCSAANLYSGGTGSVWTISVERGNDRQRSHARRPSRGSANAILQSRRLFAQRRRPMAMRSSRPARSRSVSTEASSAPIPTRQFTMSWAGIARERGSRRASSITRREIIRSHSHRPRRTTLSSPRRGQRSFPLTDRTSSTSTTISIMSATEPRRADSCPRCIPGRRAACRVISTRRLLTTAIRSIPMAIRSAGSARRRWCRGSMA